eukprot:g35602.t1
MLPDQHLLVLGCSEPGKPLLPGPRIPYSKMPSLLSAARGCLCHPDIPPHADVKNALDVVYTTTNTLETKFPKALFTVASNFNEANFKRALPKYQHISCPTRGPNILGHCYTAIKDTYRSIPHPHFGKSDQNAVFLHPVYKQKLKWEDPSQKQVQSWSEAAEERLRDCLELVDWTMFKSLDAPVPTVTAAGVRLVFLGIKRRKALGPDGVPGRALRSCADQLVDTFTDVFSFSLPQAEGLTCFKKTTTIQYLRNY